MEFREILERLMQVVPDAIGAVLCDFEGETVVTALGRTAPPEDAAERATEHVPKAMALHMPVAEFLVRLAGAEPCSTQRLLDEVSLRHRAGDLAGFSARYEAVEVLVERLPEDYYVVLVLRRPALPGRAAFQLARAAAALAPLIV